MSLLAPLIEIQDLDVAADAARARSEALPERELLPRLEHAIGEIDQQLIAARAERSGLEAEEERLGLEVAQIAREIEDAELERYSGQHKNRADASEHDESQRLRRERQSTLEESEMELLETIEALEARIADQDAARRDRLAELEKAHEAIATVEGEVSLELERLAEARTTIAPRVPSEILTAYERVRDQPRAHGKGAALLTEGRCTGCRIKLPSLEKTRMLAEPEDALIQCPQCRRVLVRP